MTRWGKVGELEFGVQILAEGHVRLSILRTVWEELGDGLGPSLLMYLKVQGTVVSGMAGSRSSREIPRAMSPSPKSAFLGARKPVSSQCPQQLSNPRRQGA